MKRLTPAMKSVALALLACLAAASAHAAPINTVEAGELVLDPPTLINPGFEWLVEGDDNRNAKVGIACRKKGETARTGKAAVTAGVTDGYSGNAPDLVALELGQTLPHYGPRS